MADKDEKSADQAPKKSVGQRVKDKVIEVEQEIVSEVKKVVSEVEGEAKKSLAEIDARVDPNLVKIEKDGQQLRIHVDALAQHIKLGWKQVE